MKYLIKGLPSDDIDFEEFSNSIFDEDDLDLGESSISIFEDDNLNNHIDLETWDEEDFFEGDENSDWV